MLFQLKFLHIVYVLQILENSIQFPISHIHNSFIKMLFSTQFCTQQIILFLKKLILIMFLQLTKEMKEFLGGFVAQFTPLSTTPTGKDKLYQTAISKFPKLWHLFLDTTATVGQVKNSNSFNKKFKFNNLI